MRRGSVIALVITLVVTLLASQGMNSSTRAQEATPASGQQAGAPEGVTFLTLASGTITFRVEADMTVARGAKAGTPVPTEPEAIPAGTEFTLSDGDSALFPPNAAGEVRNDGTEDAVAWVTNVALFTDEASTPTP